MLLRWYKVLLGAECLSVRVEPYPDPGHDVPAHPPVEEAVVAHAGRAPELPVVEDSGRHQLQDGAKGAAGDNPLFLEPVAGRGLVGDDDVVLHPERFQVQHQIGCHVSEIDVAQQEDDLRDLAAPPPWHRVVRMRMVSRRRVCFRFRASYVKRHHRRVHRLENFRLPKP
eukprot:766062-Pyramimonas_sp.AAC.2